MFNFLKRSVSFLIVVVMIAAMFLFTSCEKEENSETPNGGKIDKLEISADYVVTRPDSASNIEVALAKVIKDAIKNESGVNLTVTTDWLRPDAPAPEKEILVGETVRAESAAVYEKLEENQWAVTVANNKLIIAGKGSKALSDAVNYFVDTYIKGKTIVEIEADAEKYDTSKLVYFSWEDGETATVCSGGSYPRLYKLQDGRLMCARDGIYAIYSKDDGLTWRTQGKGTPLSFFPQYACANPAIFQMEDGEIFVAYRAVGMDGDKYYRGIHVSSSKDNGNTWQKQPDVIVTNNDDDGGVWEPHFFLINGVLTVAYANDDAEYVTPPYQHLEYKQLIDGEWTNRTIMANGMDHKSRDGMPFVIQLSTGEYVCALEGWIPNTYQLMIKLIYSEDGITWSEPVNVYRANNINAGAPAVAELPTGQLVVSFQTAEDCPDKECTQMRTVISDGTPIQYLTEENFTEPENTFATPEGYNSMWNGLYTTEDYIYAITGTGHPSGQIKLRRYPLKDME